MAEQFELPDLPDKISDELRNELIKLRYQAILDLVKADHQAALTSREAREAEDVAKDLDSRKAVRENEFTLNQAVHNAYLEAAKGEIDRVTTRADFVQKAAAAISTVYVAVIGLTFGTGEKITPLPFQGAAATIFLGVAIFLATAYVAYITKPKDIEAPKHADTFPVLQKERLNTFILWARAPSLRRMYLLQAAVVSLGIGVIFLPAPYLPQNDNLALILIIVGLVVTFLLPLLISGIQKIGEHST